MSELLASYFSWAEFLLAGVLLWGVWALLQLWRRRLTKGVSFGRFQQPLTDGVSTFLLLYEPFTIIVLTLVFLFVNPVMHGVILLLLSVVGFNRMRDYLSGRFILATTLVEAGKRMETPTASGVISRIARMGLYLQTGDKLCFVNYTKLMTDGYTIATGQKVGGYYQLDVSLKDDSKINNPLRVLEDYFLGTPYLERSFPPEVRWRDEATGKLGVRVSLREERQLGELLELMGEWGFAARISR